VCFCDCSAVSQTSSFLQVVQGNEEGGDLVGPRGAGPCQRFGRADADLHPRHACVCWRPKLARLVENRSDHFFKPMSKRGIRRKHAVDATRIHRRSHPASPTYKEAPPDRANGRAKQSTRHGQHLGPPVSHQEEGAPGGAQGSAEHGQAPVQVHFEEE